MKYFTPKSERASVLKQYMGTLNERQREELMDAYAEIDYIRSEMRKLRSKE